MACPAEHIGAGKPAPYAPNDVLLSEIRRSRKLKAVTPELARLLMAIAVGYSHRTNWRGYPYLDDMVGTALMKLTRAVFVIPQEHTKPFLYFTTTVENAFRQVVKNELKHYRHRAS